MSSGAKTGPGFVYGPVPSRRLGFSLGVDILPFKTCTLDCVYCQLGPSSRTTVRRRAFFDPKAVIRQVRKAVAIGVAHRSHHLLRLGGADAQQLARGDHPRHQENDGHSGRRAHQRDASPPEGRPPGPAGGRRRRPGPRRRDARASSPGSTGPTRPSGWTGCSKGLAAFRREFKGQIWLEVMLVAGVNDSPAHIRKLRKIIDADRRRQGPAQHRRPAAGREGRPVRSAKRRMKAICKALGPTCEIVVAFPGEGPDPSGAEAREGPSWPWSAAGPSPQSDIAASLGREAARVAEALSSLVAAGRIRSVRHGGKIYFEPR